MRLLISVLLVSAAGDTAGGRRLTGLAAAGVAAACALILLAGAVPSRAQETVLVEFGNSMLYLDNQSDPGIGMTWTDEAFDDIFYNALCLFVFKQAHSLMVGDKPPSIEFFLDAFSEGDFAHVIRTFCKISLQKKRKSP